MPKVIEQARLICVNLAAGNNKLYWLDLNDDDTVRVRYGRYREVGGEVVFQHDDIMKGGRGFFDTKKREKLRGKSGGKSSYTEQPVSTLAAQTKILPSTSLETIALQQIATNSADVKALIRYLSQANIHNIVNNTTIAYNANTGSFTTPFGLITQSGIDSARNLLSQIKGYMDKNNSGLDFERAIDNYLSIIPRDIGRQGSSYSRVFPSVDSVLKQNDVLDSLESSLVVASNPQDDGKTQAEKIFDCSLELVTDPTEFNRISKLYVSTSKDMHAFAKGFKVSKVYKLNLASMAKAWEARGKGLAEHKELWHGTSSANILSILRSGFQLTPPSTAHIAGKAFGNGIYLAIHSTKAMGYATSYWGGNGAGEKAFMFLNDVALGNYFVPKASVSTSPPAGYHTYWAKPTETRKFGGYLENDEIIIFDAAQMNPVYLVELSK